MLSDGFWSPATMDYGSTGTRPPQNFGLSSALQLQNNQTQQQKDILGLTQGFQGQQSALDRALQSAMQGNQLGFEGQQAGLNRAQQLDVLGKTQGFQGQQSALDRALQTSLQGNQLGFEGEQAGLNRQFQGGQNDAQRALELQLGMAPIDLKRSEFGQILPMMQNLIGGANGSISSGGGSAGPMPGVSVGGVYSPGQIDQQVNAMKSSNARQAGTQERQNAQTTASSGFGSHSPLLAALNNQTQMNALSANTSGERETRMGAAEANAKNILGAETARGNIWSNAQQSQNQRYNAQLGLTGSLAGALAGLL